MALSEKQLESLAFYEEHYQVIFDQPLRSDRPLALTDHTSQADRRCRFCGEGTPDVDFRQTAHAVPEFLGNKSLVSMNECDNCNSFLANQYEDHLSKWFGPMRTISQIAGKKGVPAYKDKSREHGGRIRIEMGDEGLHFTIVDADLMSQLDKEGPIAFTLPLDTPSQPYVPIRAAMALVKIGCSVCPPEELSECVPAIDWLMGRLSARISMFPVLYAFTPGPNPYVTGKVMLLRRKTDAPMPYLWSIVATANYRFQFFLPFCPKDGWLKNGGESTFTTRQFPVPFGQDWPHGATEYGLFDWSSNEPVVKKPIVTLNVDRAERVKSEPELRTGDAMADTTPTKLPISDLYPYECSVVECRVAHFIKKISANEGIDPVTVAQVDGCWVVRDGAHRVAAAKECGWTEVPVKVRPIKSSEVQPFQDALASAKKRNRMGFDELPRDVDQSARDARTKQELKDDFGLSL